MYITGGQPTCDVRRGTFSKTHLVVQYIPFKTRTRRICKERGGEGEGKSRTRGAVEEGQRKEEGLPERGGVVLEEALEQVP